MEASVLEKKMRCPVMTERQLAARWKISLKTLRRRHSTWPACAPFCRKGLMPLPARPQEALSDQIARIEQAASRRREVEKTRARPAKEKQFNRKVEINATLRQLKSELEQLSRRPPISKAQRPEERTWTN